MKICPKCNQVHDNDQTLFCTACGADLSQVIPQVTAMPVYPAVQMPMTSSAYSNFSWGDVFSIIGFVAALIGIFWCSAVLLPLSIVCSVTGFISKKTRGLAIAGLAISVVGLLIKLCVELYRAGLIPEWLTRGIF